MIQKDKRLNLIVLKKIYYKEKKLAKKNIEF
jgi:hypothetical protein